MKFFLIFLMSFVSYSYGSRDLPPSYLSVCSQDAQRLRDAARNGERPKVFNILFRNMLVVNAPEYKTKKTPLHFAVHKGRLEAVRTLMAFRANPRAYDYKKRTPTSIALAKLKKAKTAEEAELFTSILFVLHPQETSC